MIILPDLKAPRGRFMMPMRRREWMPPSLFVPKDEFGNDTTRTVYRVRARLHDGHIVWRGMFYDREDFDAFLWAIATGSLRYERELWRLPTPQWSPDIGEELTFDFATVTFLTTTGGATYTSPSDWNNSDNFIEGIGGAGSGGAACGNNSNSHSTGGGGGEYRKIANFTFATPGTTTASYTVGTGGTTVTANGSATVNASANGNAGADTTWNTTSLVAKAGGAGEASTTSSASLNGGAGGTGGTGAADSGAGGAGGANANNGSATGGGGAGGAAGAGNAGVASTTQNQVTNGGSGDAGSGGAAGTGSSTGGPGGDGTEWQVSPAYGSGGGGGGGNNATGTRSGGSGGNYGGAGGGCSVYAVTANRNATSGAGRRGLIVVTYTPVTALISGNLAMMGM